MIHSIELHNFQSHKDSRLEFVAGVNGIVGESRKGKTAILRALHWNRENKPTGEAHLSNWIKDQKKKIIGECKVIVKTTGGEIARVRSKDFNGYFLGEDKFEAINRDVPEPIKTAWGFTEINVQRQLDPPFLLSKSAPEVSRFFNQVLALDDMDKLIAAAASKADKVASDLRAIVGIKGKGPKHDRPGEIDDVAKQIQGLAWIDQAKPLIDAAQAVEKEIEAHQSTIAEIDSLCVKIAVSMQAIAKHTKATTAEPALKQAESLVNEIEAIEQKRAQIDALIVAIAQESKTTERGRRVLLAETYIDLAASIMPEIDALTEKKTEIDALISKIKVSEVVTEKSKKVLLVDPHLQKAEALQREIEALSEKDKALTAAILGIKQAKAAKEKANMVKMAEAYLLIAERAQAEIDALQARLNGLTLAVMPIKKLTAEITAKRQELELLESAMPEVCPACGQAIDHDHD